MTSVARRNQVVRYLRENYPAQIPAPGAKEWEKSYRAAAEHAFKALPKAVRDFINSELEDYNMRHFLSSFKNRASVAWTKDNPRPVPITSNKGALIRRAYSAQTEEQLQAILDEAKEPKPEK